MRTLFRSWRCAALLSALSLLGMTGVALGSEASTIIHRCTHDESLGGFTQRGYRKALRELPTGISEYTDCEELIRKAQLAAAGHRGGVSGGPGAASPTVAGSRSTPLPLSTNEQRAVQSAHHAESKPVAVGGKPITPGVVHASIASAVSTLPASLFATVALLIAGGLVYAGLLVRKHVRANRSS